METIKEKAEAYDRALEAVKRLREVNPSDEGIQRWVNESFPELKESEDERIRKELIQYFSNFNLDTFAGLDPKKILAWLEKQGEPVEINLVEILKHYPRETELYSPMYGKLWLAEVDEEHEIITCYKHRLPKGCVRAVLEQEDTISFYSNGTTGLPDFSVSKDCMLFLYDIEKQREIDEEKVLIGARKDVALSIMKFLDRCTLGMCLSDLERADLEDAVVNSDWPKVYDYMKKKLEKQGEKPQGKSALEAIKEVKVDNANKVEPKFKVGDWVIYNNDICQIVKREEGCNKLVTVFGIEKELVNERNLSTARLWTIKDAKPGDVLASIDGEDILIFARSFSFTTFSSYYSIRGEWNFGWSNSWFIPATKEQRDTLLKAMADAGYEFDFDKKELKKIEDEEYDGEDYGIDGLWHAKNILEKTLGDVEGYQTDDGILDHKCAIAAVNKLYKQKPAEWSEEDDYNLQCMVAKVTSDIQKGNVGRNNELIDWLKSLKDRYAKLG